jgi:hypothetical protein
MSYNVDLFNKPNGRFCATKVMIEDKPNICPYCERNIDAYIHNGFSVDDSDFPDIRVIFQCPNNECNEIFIGKYLYDDVMNIYCIYPKDGIEPLKYKVQKFSTYIESISKTFVEIYNEASHAESLELKQIVGPAYRKALEFLIKDYAISNKGEDEEKIKGMSLTNCIKTYIEDSKAIDCAKRATWIGNDETHYVKEWKDKDINDMKILMEIVINCIENEILHKQYLADMPYK